MRSYEETYLWDVHDADTPHVLVPHGYPEFGQWQVLKIRIRGLYAPEQWTEEGKLVTQAIKEQLLTRFLRCKLDTYTRSFERWTGDLWLPSGINYADECRRVMAELGISEGGIMDARQDREKQAAIQQLYVGLGSGWTQPEEGVPGE